MTLRGAGIAALVLGLCLASLTIGAKPIPWQQLGSLSSADWLVITASRLPRLLTVILTGIGLAVCGVIMQQIVRNRFVEPATSGGLAAAKLGILLVIIHAPEQTPFIKALGSLVVCLIATGFFVWFVRRIPFKNAVLVPIIGMMYHAVLSAGADFYAFHHNIMQSMQGWLLGDFSKIVAGHYELIYGILPAVSLGYLFAQRFTIAGMGEGFATSLGLNYSAIVALGLILVALTVSVVVITVGAIPFVGLIVPNLVAMVYGDNLSRTLPVIALWGAVLLLICDLVGRVVIFPFEVPIGLTVGFLGSIMFLLILRRQRL